MPPLTLDQLRRYAVARSLSRPTTLMRAIARLGFVQADPIRAPARAQDLILRHRVRDYRAGDLERRYPRLALEEDFFVNYGFLPRAQQAWMHPRIALKAWTPARERQACAVRAFIAERGTAHPRDVDAYFAYGKTLNGFGGASNASTQLLDDMHYRGLLRVARREGGTRVYAVREPLPPLLDVDDIVRRMDALLDLLVQTYAPLPVASLRQLMTYLGRGVPQWRDARAATFERARTRLGNARVDGVDWVWPADEAPRSRRWRPDDAVRLLTPFDPVVWDRRRFELFWAWRYRFEAYTPAPKRQLGYYALPLLWGERVIGWGNLSVVGGALVPDVGYVDGRPPRDATFRDGLEAEFARMRAFLSRSDTPPA